MRCFRHFAALSNRGRRGSEVESDDSQQPKRTWAALEAGRRVGHVSALCAHGLIRLTSPRQSRHRRLVKSVWCLDLTSMANFGKFDEPGIGNRFGRAEWGAYGASKAALRHLTD